MDATESMEQAIISGVTHDTSEAKVTIEQVPDRPGVAATVFRDLAEAGVNVDMIVQNVSTAGHTDISFTVPRADTHKAGQCMEKIVVDTEASGYRTDDRIAFNDVARLIPPPCLHSATGDVNRRAISPRITWKPDVGSVTSWPVATDARRANRRIPSERAKGVW